MTKLLYRWFILSLIVFMSYATGIIELVYAVDRPSTPLRHSSVARAQQTPQEKLAIKAVLVGQQQVPRPTVAPSPVSSNEWGKAKQVDEHTWTIQVGEDAAMATPQEILSALNEYRQKHGRGGLMWDDRLGEYAKTRSDYFLSTGRLDGHAGFSDYLDNQDGFTKLGFRSIGENSSLGYRQSGVHLIEWVYAGDKPHDDNQLDSKWHFVGIGVSGLATDLIFGGEKL